MQKAHFQGEGTVTRTEVGKENSQEKRKRVGARCKDSTLLHA